MTTERIDAPTDGMTHGDLPVRVIFVCTGNSARSQMAEALLRRDGGEAFEVVSAGVSPRGVHPMTITALAKVGIDITGARSKSVGEFLGQRFDYVITVCDRAGETCPVFPGDPERLHWSLPDPSAAEGDEAARLAAFAGTAQELFTRIRYLVTLIGRPRA